MVSFEFSVIDIVLLVTIAVLLALYLTKPSAKPGAKPEPSIKEEETHESPQTIVEIQKPSEETVVTTDVETKSSAKCAHQLGYLRELPRDASIPDECYTCTNYIRCAFEDK